MAIFVKNADGAYKGYGTAIPGAALVDPGYLHDPLNDLADSPELWDALFHESLSSVQRLLSSRDCLSALAKCAMLGALNERRQIEDYAPSDQPDNLFHLLRQPHIEFLYALCLMQPSALRLIPTSPRNMTRIMNGTVKCVHSFLKKQPQRYPNDAEKEHVLSAVRAQTVHYRNIYSKEDCDLVVRTILLPLDDHSARELGFRLSEAFTFLQAIAAHIEKKLQIFLRHVIAGRDAPSESAAIAEIDYFCELSPLAKRSWSLLRRRSRDLNGLRAVAFQLSEFCYRWAYTVELEELRQGVENLDLSFLERISIQPGTLSKENPERFLMANPIWRRPYVLEGKDAIFAPLPMLCYSFPFLIIEQLIAQSETLRALYFDSRAKSLEGLIRTYVQTAMPSASVHSNVCWREEESGVLYENDIVAEVGNSIFLFEAKAGRLDEVSRRGGELSLKKDFRDLFVLPGEQASRLARYLNTHRSKATLWSKNTGARIALDLDTPKVVYKFSICIEHFAELTSAKHNLKALGAIRADSDWAPILSIGELMLICRHLDTEVSFYHYLTRRATLEEFINMEGDEQDILSMYLMNGFCIDPEPFKKHQLRFFGFDTPVRVDKSPRSDRTEFYTWGIRLSSYWNLALKEIYQAVPRRHRFDMIEVVLNQHPDSLAAVSGKARRWKRNFRRNKENLFVVCNRVSSRTFALAYHVTNGWLRGDEWLRRGREIAGSVGAEYGATDCVVMLRVRKSKDRTFDAASFFRLDYVGSEENNLSC